MPVDRVMENKIQEFIDIIINAQSMNVTDGTMRTQQLFGWNAKRKVSRDITNSLSSQPKQNSEVQLYTLRRSPFGLDPNGLNLC